MLAEAVRNELVEPNVAAIVRGPASTAEDVRPWLPDEASAFRRAAEGDRLYALFAVSGC